LAADGRFDVRATSPGTEVTVSIPLEPAVSGSDREIALAGAQPA
jgi:two-component system NarL family sensor kinase